MNLTRNGKLGVLAVIAIALVAGGGAFAATKLHSGGGSKAAARSSTTSSYRTRFGNGRHFGGGGGGGFGAGGSFQAAASYLGISVDQLVQDLRSGKTLAQVANATSGKSASGLIDAMVAALPAEQRAGAKARITAMVNGTGFGGRGGRGGRGGFGGPQGPPPGTA